MKRHYVYYSYEEWGRGYIGARSSFCAPEEDSKYFGSFKDKSFKPTYKIIIAEFPSREEAIEAEIALQRFYKVVENPHFANRAYQTSTKFLSPLRSPDKKGGRPKKLTNDQILWAAANVKRHDAQWGLARLAEKLGVHRMTLQRALAQLRNSS